MGTLGSQPSNQPEQLWESEVLMREVTTNLVLTVASPCHINQILTSVK